MTSSRFFTCLIFLFLLNCYALAAGPGKTPPRTVVLGVDTACFKVDEAPPNNPWRYFEVWQTDVVKTDAGPLVRVDMYNYSHEHTKGKMPALEDAKKIEGSELPADGWHAAEFDDQTWVRRAAPFTNDFRSLAMICLRGKFMVADPAGLPDMDLQVKYQGGVVVYINGREIGRQDLPDGALTIESLATEYPRDAYVNPKGELLDIWRGEWLMPYPFFMRWFSKDAEKVRRYTMRSRSFTAKIPASLLKKGVNVLAMEIHRSPANETMYTNPKQNSGEGDNNWFGPMAVWWNRCTLEDAELTLPNPSPAVTPATVRPKGIQIWNQSLLQRVVVGDYADPCESLRPIELKGTRNGTFSGQIVVSSDQPIKALKVTASDLTTEAGGKIDAANITIGYAMFPPWADQWHTPLFDILDTKPRAEIPLAEHQRPGAGGAVQPLWVSVLVPKTAAPGMYQGNVTVSADGLSPMQVPLHLEVIGSKYVLPDAKDFKFYMGVLESPDSLATQYNVPLWSDEHWKLIDQAFELLATIGVKEVHIPVIEHTQLGNEHSMVRWIKQPDGTFKLDFSIAQKYLDIASRHLQTVEAVVVGIEDNTSQDKYPGVVREQVMATQWDPTTQTASEMPAPTWGTPEALAFWKPVVAGLDELLAKHGLKGKMLFGSSSNGTCNPKEISDLRQLAPSVYWVNVTHIGAQNFLSDKATGQKVGQLSCVRTGVLWVHWDPEKDKPIYGWLSNDPMVFLCSSRGKNSPDLSTNAEPGMYRVLTEGCFLSLGWGGPQRGVGHVGADFWPVVRLNGGKDSIALNEKWTNWSSLTMSQVILWLIGPGHDGPVATERLRLLQESLQESELRIFVTDALLDPTKKAKLGHDLSERAQQMCDDRTRLLRYFSLFFGGNGNDLGRIMNNSQWQDQSAAYYRLADEMTNALAK